MSDLLCVCFSGVSWEAGRVSAGSLRAHVELLEQRLQTPPIVRPHPLLPYRGRHEHGLKRNTGKVEGALTGNVGTFLFYASGDETPLVRFFFPLLQTPPKTNTYLIL